MKFTLALLAIALLLVSPAPTRGAEDYRLERMKGNVYRFTAGKYHSALMVTEAGIFLTDPINPAAARWLRTELESRFDLPLRYLAYSHNHIDHVLGGQELADEATTVIAHAFAAEDLAWTRVPTAKPDITFHDSLLLELGDSHVELKYHGPNNGRGSVSMRFMPANVLFVVDWIVLGRMPYQDLPGYDIHGMIRSTREVLTATPFALFIGGHGKPGTRDDVARYLQYLEALYNAVLDGMLEGKSLPTLQAEISLPDFRDLERYEEWLPLNVAGVYRTLDNMSYLRMREDIRGENAEK
jgi:glyoxylase-like metal-dependent hydrolase (beta-lactamase superfamily II)